MNHKNAVSRALAAFDTKPKAHPVPKSKGADVVGIVEEDHGNYRIKAGRLGGNYVARAFPKPPTRAQGLIAEAEGETEEAAIAALKAKIVARDVHRKGERRWDETASVSVPNQAEYVEALYQTPLTRAQIAMLKAHSFASEKGMTIDQLARAAGYRSRDTAGRVFRKAGDLIADYLGIEIDGDASPDRDGSALMLAYKNVQAEDVQTIWIMHPELRAAVQVAL